jgi:hypothetical protein
MKEKKRVKDGTETEAQKGRMAVVRTKKTMRMA